MKTVLKSPQTPSLLRQYSGRHPANTWEQFRKRERRYTQVKQKILDDQRGLCAYCEIDLKPEAGGQVDDFHVEHFYPKNPPHPTHNYALDWTNLLGVCHGGSKKEVKDGAQRYTSPDESCDRPKGNKNLLGIILNPLTDIGPWDHLFEFEESTGAISRHSTSCPAPMQAMVDATIRELCLDGTRLKRFRKNVIDELGKAIEEELLGSKTFDQAVKSVAEAQFQPFPAPWPRFFTCIRWYLSTAAEARLQLLAYVG